jgi:hypothetical protein
MAEDGETIPLPSHHGDLMLDASWNARPGAWVYVSIEEPDSPERVNVYLQRSLLERIDRFVERAAINRSAFFNFAARAYMGAPEAPLDRHQMADVTAMLAELTRGGQVSPEAARLEAAQPRSGFQRTVGVMKVPTTHG